MQAMDFLLTPTVGITTLQYPPTSTWYSLIRQGMASINRRETATSQFTNPPEPGTYQGLPTAASCPNLEVCLYHASLTGMMVFLPLLEMQKVVETVELHCLQYQYLYTCEAFPSSASWAHPGPWNQHSWWSFLCRDSYSWLEEDLRAHPPLKD
jgi:hypothetical protein